MKLPLHLLLSPNSVKDTLAYDLTRYDNFLYAIVVHRTLPNTLHVIEIHNPDESKPFEKFIASELESISLATHFVFTTKDEAQIELRTIIRGSRVKQNGNRGLLWLPLPGIHHVYTDGDYFTPPACTTRQYLELSKVWSKDYGRA